MSFPVLRSFGWVLTLALLMGWPLVKVEPAVAQESQSWRILINGSDWLMTTPSGRQAVVRFSPGGTGRLEMGEMVLAVGWHVRNNEFCIDVHEMEKCLLIRNIDGSLIGRRGDVTDVTFRQK